MWACGYWATKGSGSFSLHRGLAISQQLWIQHPSQTHRDCRLQKLCGLGITRQCPHRTPGCLPQSPETAR